MLPQFVINYTSQQQEDMKCFYNSLNEKDRRHYAALEANRLGHGGIEYVASVLHCSRNTIKSGMDEIKKKLSSSK